MPKNEDSMIDYIRCIAGYVYKTNNCRGLHVDELISEGWIAYSEEKKKYDPSRGVPLEAFVYRRVRGAMLDAIKAVKPRGYRKNIKPGQRNPIREIEYEDASNGSESDMHFKAEMSQVNTRLIRILNNRERVILVKRAAGEKLKDLSKRFRVSKERIWQIEKVAAGKVKKEME